MPTNQSTETYKIPQLPVKYCRNHPVQVHSGEPRRRGYMQSKWIVLPGRTANTPDGSYDAEPTPTLILIDGGLSSV